MMTRFGGDSLSLLALASILLAGCSEVTVPDPQMESLSIATDVTSEFAFGDPQYDKSSGRYGNWCGPGWSGGIENGIGTGTPVDDLDWLCRTHDFSYNGADLTWGPSFVTANKPDQNKICKAWARAYDAADKVLASGAGDLPHLESIPATGPDAWNYDPARPWGVHPKDRLWRNLYRDAVQYVFKKKYGVLSHISAPECDQLVLSIEIVPGALQLDVGQDFQLTPLVLGGSALSPKIFSYPVVSWKSSRPSVVTVDGTGRIRAVTVGTGKITVTSHGKHDDVTITVVPAPPPPAPTSQFSQQGPKLVAADAVGGGLPTEQGGSVSLSADGNTAIVGIVTGSREGPWVWTRSAGVWTPETKLVGSDGLGGNAFQGYSVSLSADGNTAIVGGPADDSWAGAAWVWTRSGGVWTQQGPKLVGSGAVGPANQGHSVSLSGDGNTAIVGGWSDNGGAGAIWVWTRSGGVWTQQGTKLVGSGAAGAANQGYSVCLSADGNTAIVGGVADNSVAGAAWAWMRSGGVWTQQGTKLVGSGAVDAAGQGLSVSLSADGNTAIVGGPNDNGTAGAAWVWTRTGGVWAQQGTKLVGSGAAGSAWQGYSVSVSGDGNSAIVGGKGDNGFAGAAWVWTRSGEVWSQQGTKLVGLGAVGSGYQGHSVFLSADGSTAIVGAPADNDQAGAVWVFTSGDSNP